jgi:hypothetical protein
MQVGVSAAEDQADVVAAAVAVIGAVKRLVDVSDEMHDELERSSRSRGGAERSRSTPSKRSIAATMQSPRGQSLAAS